MLIEMGGAEPADRNLALGARSGEPDTKPQDLRCLLGETAALPARGAWQPDTGSSPILAGECYAKRRNASTVTSSAGSALPAKRSTRRQSSVISASGSAELSSCRSASTLACV